MSKSVETTATPTTTPTAPAAVPFLDHLQKGATDMLMQHLHGVSMGLTHFLAAREQAHAEGKGDSFEVLKTLNAAHRKYKAHTHDTTNTLVDHVLSHKSVAK